MNNITINKILKSELNDNIEINQIYFTEDGGIYATGNDGVLKKSGVDDETKNIIDETYKVKHEHINNDILNGFSKNEKGNLIFEGNEISSGDNYATNISYVENANIIGVSCNNKENSLQALYDFDKYSGESFLKDSSPAKNHSTVFKQKPSFEIDDELERQVSVFNGNQYISFGKNTKFPMTSVFVMAYSDNWENIKENTIISCNNDGGYSMSIDTTGKFMVQAYINGSYKKITGTISSSGWHVFSFTFDGYYLIAYIDKKEIGRITISNDLIKYNIDYNLHNSILLGAEAYAENTPSSLPAYFNGKISEVRIYNKGLTKEEILEVYNEILNHKPLLYDIPIVVNGDYVKKIEINELSNPLTAKPLEYGWFGLSKDININELSIIPFDTIKDGNVYLPEHGVFSLKQGVIYEIDLDIYVESSETDNTYFECYNVETNEVLITCEKSLNLNGSNMIFNSLKGFITPIKDIQIGFRSNALLNNIYSKCSHVIIKEIRNNPINQYGGFQNIVLFEGSAVGVNNEFILTDDSDKYDLFLIMTTKSIIYNKTPIMTSDITPKPFKVSSSSMWDGYNPFYAFDTSISGYGWCSASGKTINESIQIYLGERTKISAISMTCNYSTLAPTAIQLYGSYDDSNDNFRPLEKITFENWVSSATQTIKLSQRYNFAHYKFEILDCNPGATYISIDNIKLCLTDDNEHITNSIMIPKENRYVDRSDYKFEINKNVLTMKSSNMKISKIIGIKGQLPSLLIGGDF